jgi:hypothetical protein
MYEFNFFSVIVNAAEELEPDSLRIEDCFFFGSPIDIR